MNFKGYLIQQINKHPSMMPQDVVKLCYQAAFGAEHLLSDVSAAKRYFDAEYEASLPSDREIVECLSDSMARVNIGVWKYIGMPREWLFNMFVASVGLQKGGRSVFEKYLGCVNGEIIEALRFSYDDWQHYLEAYKAEGVRAVHHSELYRQEEKPSYRLVNREFIKYFALLEKLNEIRKEGVKVIAIDGRAAAGKTTLAGRLSAILKAEIVHMDDFFLPPPLCTRERLGEVGGNIHYERFCNEVIPFIGKKEGFSYGIFDCSQMAMNGERAISYSEWRIVEGSYSHHPRFDDYSDFRIFCSVSESEQMHRILDRNGEQMAARFRKCWIPMEEAYFSAFRISERSDYVFETDHIV